jgi:hypothetical protein
MPLRFKAAAIISAALLAVGAAATFATPASAVDDQPLCGQAINSATYCAVLNEALGVVDTYNGYPPPAYGYWNVNTSSSTYHQISSTYNGYCMEFLGPSNPQIVVVPCEGSTYEEWRIAYQSGEEYELQNEKFTGDCLNIHYQIGEVDAAPCNKGPDELWYS